ncbi:hypothetical protein AC578_7239 [Pseudocercospora eumusae]|uniref:Multicopper oxidase n=1 Tax=Pseudocercospora eumusae TaxID=321146 RepID=A0A139HWJ6_9PEZI|nr:hypothetical protein AC578_7239 [Pseudocercospora eumusae]
MSLHLWPTNLFIWTACCLLISPSIALADPIRFELTLTHGNIDPAGIGNRTAILINGQFPGPTLRLQQFENVEFVVHNHLREDTTVHFHGISQAISPWSDGTPGVSQRAIRPGASFRYRWQADESGVYFYHAHNRGQIMDGMYGAIVVAASSQVERPFHLISSSKREMAKMLEAEAGLQPLMLSDWTQFTFDEFMGIEKAANIDFTCMDALLMNGVGSQYCLDRNLLDKYTSPLVKQILDIVGEKGITDKGCVPPLQLFQGNFSLHLDQLPQTAYYECVGGSSSQNYTVNVSSLQDWVALTFINPGGLYPIKVTIDNHKLHVYAVDGQYIEPQIVDQLLINNGNRISVLVRLDQESAAYTIRMANDLLGQVLGGYAVLSYDGSMKTPKHAKPLMNHAGFALVDNLVQFTEANGRTFPSRSPARKVDASHKFLMKKIGAPHGAYEWTLSGTSGYNMSEEHRAAVLFEDAQNVPGSDVVIKTRKGDWVDFIIEVEGPFAQAHPMHRHSSKGYVVGRGVGSFPWSTVAEAEKQLPEDSFNFVDPPYRDSFSSLEGVNNNTWLVYRYHVENAGAWLFHCHIQTHLAGGMAVVVLDGVDTWPEVPEAYKEWNGFDEPGDDAIFQLL